MQAKIFLSSFLATLLSVGVIATPTGVGPRGLAVIGGAVDTIETLVESTISGVDVILDNIDNALTPGEGDVPLVSTGVEARDLESLTKRAPGCIYMTSNSGFTGRSARTCLRFNGACYNLTPFWKSNISSFRPDRGTTCKVFTGPDCSGTASVPFRYPGYGNLGAFNDNVGSLACRW